MQKDAWVSWNFLHASASFLKLIHDNIIFIVTETWYILNIHIVCILTYFLWLNIWLLHPKTCLSFTLYHIYQTYSKTRIKPVCFK